MVLPELLGYSRLQCLGRASFWAGLGNCLNNGCLYAVAQYTGSWPLRRAVAPLTGPVKEHSGAVRSIATSAVRCDNSVEELGPPIKRPLRYLDMKTFRLFLKQQKIRDIEKEKRAIAQAHAKPPPEGWGILEFLNAAGITEGAELIAESFDSWNEFISSTMEELYANNSMTNKQRRTIFKHITYVGLYNHGMWPLGKDDDYISTFQAKPLDNEGKPWDAADDAELLRLAEYYDAEYGDPWLYLSWEMQRTPEDVQERYIELVTIPKYRSDTCEIAVTKAHKPLLMNRKFKLDPPFLYIIPSKENFPLTPVHRSLEDRTPVEPKETFSEKFQAYRRPECFQN
ncbi:homeodomain-like containing protein [Babesia ovata]|uniref:Homeodomain-like containing protein n=1 Tax=Babesia ovata TaxID=189622 RepID=A0A2H6KDG1_9APIC|nr:homeodomain-like containing protein [Babesia ovata]GBE61027.1 homeodomain-like containing protein [Babesia ovata]